MRRAQAGDVQPQVLGLGRIARNALAAPNMLGHAARNHVARGQFGLFRLVIGHETVAVHVAQQAAVATATLGHENAGRHDGRGVELHRFHVGQTGHAGFQSQGGAHAFVDQCVGGDAIDAAMAAGGHHGGFGHPGSQFTRDQIPHHRALAAAAVVDQRNRFHALVHGNALRHGTVTQRVQHGVAGTVGGVAGAPFARAAKIARGDQAVGFVALGQRDTLAVDDGFVVALAHAVPRHAPGGQFAHGLGRHVGEHAGDQLIAPPVGAAHRILEMHILVVAGALDGVGQACLHAALGGHGMGALGRHQREDAHVQPAAACPYGAAQSGQATANHENIGMPDFHCASSWIHAGV